MSRIRTRERKLELRINSRVPMYEIEMNTTADIPDKAINYLSSPEQDVTPKAFKPVKI